MKAGTCALRYFLPAFLIVGNECADAAPAEVRLNLDEIAETVDKSPYFGFADLSLVDRFWQALDNLGRIATPELAKELAPQLQPVEIELLYIASTLRQRPQLAETLSQWYGRYAQQVPREVRKIENDQEWAALQNPIGKERVSEVEPLHDEHAGEDHRHAWEAWLLSPGTREKHKLVRRACEAIARIANPQSLPVLVAAFKDAVKDRPTNYSSPARDIQCWELLYTIHSFRSNAALLALLECREVGIREGVGRGAAVYYAKDKSFDESFVRMMSGSRNVPHAPSVDESPKAYLPYIESQLDRSDVPAATRELLNQIAQRLRSL